VFYKIPRTFVLTILVSHSLYLAIMLFSLVDQIIPSFGAHRNWRNSLLTRQCRHDRGQSQFPLTAGATKRESQMNGPTKVRGRVRVMASFSTTPASTRDLLPASVAEAKDVPRQSSTDSSTSSEGSPSMSRTAEIRDTSSQHSRDVFPSNFQQNIWVESGHRRALAARLVLSRTKGDLEGAIFQ